MAMNSQALARLKAELKRGPKLTRQGRVEYLKQLIQQTKGKTNVENDQPR
jgi:hypothetical protein